MPKKRVTKIAFPLLIFGISLNGWICTLQRRVQNGREAIFVCEKGLVEAEITAFPHTPPHPPFLQRLTSNLVGGILK